MKILVLTEVLDSTYRVGQEVQLLAISDILTARGHEIVLATPQEEPVFPQGMEPVDTIRILRDPKNRFERYDLMRGLENYLSGGQSDLDLAAEAEVEHLRDHLRRIDSVLILGFTPNNSLNAGAIYARAALTAVAKSLGKPVIFSCQLVTEPLDKADGEVLARAFSLADRVGIANQKTLEWCSEREIRATPSVELASLFTPKQRSLPRTKNYDILGEIGELENAYVGVTLDHLTQQDIVSVASLLDRLYAETRIQAVFIPHATHPKLQDGDARVHRDIAAHMWSPSVVLPTLHADTVAGLHQIAAFNLSNNCRAIAMGLRKGVPGFGFYGTSQTFDRIDSVLANFGLEDFIAPLGLAGSEPVFKALVELANRFESYSNIPLRHHAENMAAEAENWWNLCTDLMSRKCVDKSAFRGIPGPDPIKVPVASTWRKELKLARIMSLDLMVERETCQMLHELSSAQTEIFAHESDQTRRRAHELERMVGEQHEQIAELKRQLADAQKRGGWAKFWGRG